MDLSSLTVAQLRDLQQQIPAEIKRRESQEKADVLNELRAVAKARGYAIDVIDQIPWLRGLPIAYWGDIDTHGLAILDRLRSRLPQVQSLLMDEATLLRFRNLWVEEAKPARVPYLPNLTPVEAKLYAGLRCGTYGTRVRLEQERIPWDWAWNNVRGWLATL